ncbi:hypothetical protein [Escherichia coli]|uniref:hypothetical protein n=1 Tax=Escherichia coli TaxID=562 RepID=UPI000BB9847A|nr:hypothetical protein [Escherichia coli]
MLPSETMIWQPEFTDKTLSRKTGAVHFFIFIHISPDTSSYLFIIPIRQPYPPVISVGFPPATG